MKKLFSIIFLLCIQYSQSQQIFTEAGTGNKYYYIESREFVPAKIKILGKNDKPAIAAKIIEILNVSGTYIRPTFVKNKGYGKGGTFSYIYINDKYFDKVQFLDETEKKLRYIINPASTVSAKDAQEACSTQLAVLRSAYNQAKKLGIYNTTKQKVYIDDSNPDIEETVVPVKINSNDFQINENEFQQLQENPSGINYGRIKNVDYSLNKKVSPLVYQEQATTYQVPSTTHQTVSYIDECTVLQQKYPSLFELYQKTQSKKVFNNVNWSERLDLKRCATGKTYFGRNWGWIVPLAASLVFTGIDAVSNDVNVIWGKNQPNNNPGGIIHTEPQGGN
jgi:hypothetical protein